MPVSTGFLGEVDIKLKELQLGKVLDIGDLGEQNLETLKNFYEGSIYDILRTGEDNYHPGKQFIAFIKTGEKANA